MRAPSLSTVRFAVLVAIVLALFTSGIVVGAAGAPLILGETNASGSQGTTMLATTSGPLLELDNRGSGRALLITDEEAVPLRVIGPAGRAPMAVNSSVAVANLNADLVDGFGASSLVRIVSTSSADLPGDGVGGTLLSVSFSPPGRGWLSITGGMDVESASDSSPTCYLTLNGDLVTGSLRGLDPHENCATNGTVAVCGPATIALNALSVDELTSFQEGAIQAVFTPFSGSGLLPSCL